MSIAFRFYLSSISNDVLHALDEVMDNMSSLTKKLPLRRTHESWKQNSPNFMRTCKSKNLLIEEHVNQRLNYENLVNKKEADDETNTCKKNRD